MFLVLLHISWWELQLLRRPIHIPGEPSPPSLLGPLLWALSLLKHQQGGKKFSDMRRDRKLSWQQHCPELHLLSVSRWICEVSARCPPPTTRPQLFLDSFVTIRDVHTFGLWNEYTKLNNRLFLDMVWWLQWNKIILIKNKKNLIRLWPQLLVPSLFPALTLVFCRAGMLTHGNVFPSTLQEMHHRSLWCCWRWWWWWWWKEG